MAKQEKETKVTLDPEPVLENIRKIKDNNQSPRSSEGSIQGDEDDDKDYKIFNDPVHGHIQLESILIKFIDTPQIQRLRYIKQLGYGYGVFPGASHNRFEHAIGVCHLAGELVEHIMQLQRDEYKGPMPIITERDALCVKIAALCYNLGHGPYSHVFDQMCTKKVGAWNLEKASVVMFQHLVDENNLVRSLCSKGIGDLEMRFIKSIIDQSLKIPEEMGNKAFLRSIVRDPDTNIDAVTQDSIARDSYLLNLPCNFDHKRLIKFVRLMSDSEKYVLCYREKEVQDLYAMLHSHHSLQARAYKHKTTQLMEKMLEEALTEADNVMKFTETALCLLSNNEDEHTVAAKKYTQMTDYVTSKIMESTDEPLRKSREILDKIQKRELKKLIGTVSETTESSMSVEDLETKLNELKRLAEERADLETCTILLVEYRFGTKRYENPIEQVYFYYKSNPSVPVHIRREQVSKILIPAVFSEVFLRVYCDRGDDATSYQSIAQKFQDLIQQNQLQQDLKWNDHLAHTHSSNSTPSPVHEQQ